MGFLLPMKFKAKAVIGVSAIPYAILLIVLTVAGDIIRASFSSANLTCSISPDNLVTTLLPVAHSNNVGEINFEASLLIITYTSVPCLIRDLARSIDL